MPRKERLRDHLAYKAIGYTQPTFKARLMDKLPFYAEVAFCEGVRCYISSTRELKRSRQVFDAQMYQWLKSFSPGDVFYDIGANIGMFSLTVSKLYDKQVKVYAFEPSFSTFASLVRNVIINEFGDVIFPHYIALGSVQGLRNFNYMSIVSGDAVHTLDTSVNQSGNKFSPIFSQEMISYPLDELIEKFAFKPPTHVKIDVDGGELEVLEGMKKTLHRSDIKSVMVEVTESKEENSNYTKILKIFEEAGFKQGIRIPHKSTKKISIISDLLFTKS